VGAAVPMAANKAAEAPKHRQDEKCRHYRGCNVEVAEDQAW